VSGEDGTGGANVMLAIGLTEDGNRELERIGSPAASVPIEG
jgi:hypothetical protein